MRTFITKQTGLLLLLSGIVTGEALKNEERLSYNASIHEASFGTLSTRDLFGLNRRAYECRAGYSECAYDSSRCCPSTGGCCGNGYCADSDEVCCTGGTCPSGWNCCGTDNCSPKDGECCSDGKYCLAGYKCMINNGRKVCCPSSGCLGSSDEGEATTATSTETDTETLTTTTATYRYHSYYYTTYYWTYWYYFWTSYSPYTVKTVTSTETTTTTIWSAYATASAEASESFEYYITARLTPPYSATSLKSSTESVPISTASDNDSTGTATASPLANDDTGSSSNEGGGFQGTGSAGAISTSGNVAWIGAVFACVVGGLAFGL
ncbi:hypothetical protein N7532_011800 [Penicillium argentinense]|uniref:GPI anchored protein n=1 Tax=Penicillium argentinense TaxID=1131581 RepID=A0A9W9JVL1_9EURO|nr:uncharacterized protein N7532_011800 [Penicillium argentinense]KAJ5082757.1 hypothetical protein N7532_011800 [Penicillium argentinense]